MKNDLTQLKKDDSSVRDMIEKLERSSNIHEITMPSEKSEFRNATEYDKPKAVNRISQGSTIYYDPQCRVVNKNNIRAPKIGLVHELQHSYDLDRGEFDPLIMKNGILLMDIRAVNRENVIRKITGD